MNVSHPALPANNPRTSRLAQAAGILLCAGVALASYRYIFGTASAPPNVAGNAYLSPALAIHAASAATALLIGPAQFFASLRARRPTLHRWLGRLYVLCCLIGGVSGLVLALGASSGPVAVAGFGLLAVAWIATTILAWRAAMQRRFNDHRAWMIRSFALTCAAVTLRIYIPIALALPVPFELSYRAIAFLCWVPNLLAAELYLRHGKAAAVK